MRHSVGWVLILLAITILMGGCDAPTAQPTVPPQTANPASENCLKLGGKLVIEKRGDSGEFGVCLFEDNLQCEEWALYRGECPVGGRKITGYTTEAARYCAITGGEYHITANGGTDQETGTCNFKNNRACQAADYYNGKCTAETGTAAYTDPFAYCAAVGTVDKADERYTGDALPDSVVEVMLQRGIVSADAPFEFQRNAVWRCMDGDLMVCHFGANLPCAEKADTSQTPSADMEAFCKENRNAEVIPAAVTGRATVYEWKCADGKPAVVKQVFTSDTQGYLAESWYNLTQPEAAYSDPFAYCAAVGTMDTPDANYTGEKVPDSILKSMNKQGIVSADAPVEFQKNAVWRCMNGKVWVCHFGANIPCEEKVDTSQVPSAEMEAFCKENRAAEVIPAAVTGRATAYEWKCTDGKPAVVKQVFAADARGYVAEFWYELER